MALPAAYSLSQVLGDTKTLLAFVNTSAVYPYHPKTQRANECLQGAGQVRRRKTGKVPRNMALPASYSLAQVPRRHENTCSTCSYLRLYPYHPKTMTMMHSAHKHVHVFHTACRPFSDEENAKSLAKYGTPSCKIVCTDT